MRTLLFTFSILLLIHFNSSSQNSDNNWFFGGIFSSQATLGAQINFNNITGGYPSSNTNSAMSYTEGSAFISDNNGNLLFYTNGLKVWNSTNTVMPNGTGLSGTSNSTIFPALIVPNPANANQYYIFANDGHPTGNGTGLFHSMVDMTLDNCKGDVLQAGKKTPLVTNTSEFLQGAYHANNTDYWAVTIDESNATGQPLKIYAYHISAAGVSAPVISNLSAIINNTYDVSWFKISPDGQKAIIMVSGMNDRKHLLFNFNNTTGQFTFVNSFATYNANNGTGNDSRGGGFSPNSQYYYCYKYPTPFAPPYNISLVQYNVNAITTAPTTVLAHIGNVGDFRNGPDNKMYLITDDHTTLSVINSPNSAGTACNVVVGAVNLNGRKSSVSLPNTHLKPFIFPPANLVPTVQITASPSNQICLGENVLFTAIPTNGGATPIFQWQINGINVGTNSNTFNSSTLQNNDVVSVIMTSSSPCVTNTPVVSNAITISILQGNSTPSVTITSNPTTPICFGTNVTFTATPTNGGNTPIYQWQINGNNVGANSSTFSSSSLNNNDQISVILTSNQGCLTTTNAVSNTITIQVNPATIPTIQISSNQTGGCLGSLVEFNVTATNTGLNPVYSWMVNGVNVANGTIYNSTNLNTGDVVTCNLLSNEVCASPLNVTSNQIMMNFSTLSTPTIQLNSILPQPFCQGMTAVFNATITNGGTNPIITWYLNGTIVQTNGFTFQSITLQNGDILTATLVSNADCLTNPNANSNILAMSIIPVSTVSATIASNLSSICENQTVSFTSNTNSTGQLAYSWLINGIPSGINTPNFSSDDLVNGDIISLEISTSENCITNPIQISNEIPITVHPLPIANFTFSPENPSDLNTFVQFSNLSENATVSNWNIEGISSNEWNPSHVFNTNSNFNVSLTVSNQFCNDSIQIMIPFSTMNAYYIPNSFTPDGDQYNQVFKPIFNETFDENDYSMLIFNRWGQLVFETTKINEGWNGLFNDSKSSQEGTYTYKIKCLTKNTSEHFEIIGHVNLLK